MGHITGVLLTASHLGPQSMEWFGVWSAWGSFLWFYSFLQIRNPCVLTGVWISDLQDGLMGGGWKSTLEDVGNGRRGGVSLFTLVSGCWGTEKKA